MNKQHNMLFAGSVFWFAFVYWFAARGGFVSGPTQPPITVAAAFATPLLLFLAAVRIFPGFRRTVVSISPIFLIALNGWRFIGLGFLMGYAEGLLPGGFAWPAGLGDIFMAVTAPWIAARVAANDQFRFTTGFLVWNLLGIADFLDAVFLGTLYMWPGFTSSVDTTLMQRLPFALIPAFFVPLVAMAHITLLEQRRRRKNGGR
jgi:hypothetical protein